MPTPTLVRFTNREENILSKLKRKMRARTRSEVVRRSVAHSQFLVEQADEQGLVTVRLKNGEFAKFRVTT